MHYFTHQGPNPENNGDSDQANGYSHVNKTNLSPEQSVFLKHIFYREYDIVQGLLKTDNSLVNLQNLRGETPLHIAAKSEDIRLACLLLQFKPNHMLCTNSGERWFEYRQSNLYVDLLNKFPKDEDLASLVQYISTKSSPSQSSEINAPQPRWTRSCTF